MNFFLKLRELWKCFFCWKVKPSAENEVRNAEVILAQSFGFCESGHSKSNKALARIVNDLYQSYGLPLILQWHIADCLPNLEKAGIIYRHREGKYLDTYEVLCQSVEICKKKGWQRAIIVAHPHHYWRVKQVAEKMGFVVLSLDTSSVPYDRKSMQFFTKNRCFWWPREIVARLIYFIRGWI